MSTAYAARSQLEGEADLSKIFPPNHLHCRTSRNHYEDSKSIRIRVPKGIAGSLVSDRQKQTTYETNKHIKAAALYLLLKSLTQSGKIQDWKFQQIEIAQLLRVTPKTLNKWRDLAELRGYLKYDNYNNTVTLFSYEQFCERLGAKSQGYHVLALPRAAVKFLPVLLYGIEVKENKASQQFYAMKKLLLNPRLASAMGPELSLPKLKAAQISAFIHGSKGEGLYDVNADDNRNLVSLRVAWGMKDRRSAAYVKRKLFLCGGAMITRRCYASDHGAWTRHYFTKFNPLTRVRTTFMPDEIELNGAFYQ
jgi:hypothetical protein